MGSSTRLVQETGLPHREPMQIQTATAKRPMTSGEKTSALLRALRIHQWVKNLLVFIPLLMAHRVKDFEILWEAMWAFFSFSLFSSAMYVINDIVDLELDRKHPDKRFRPFAAGAIDTRMGLPLAAGLVVLGAFVGWLLPLTFVSAAIVYVVTACSYSYYLKRIPVLDVLVLSGLYSLRVLAGGFATSITVSPWLLAFSMFFFLSLAYVKRYSELRLVVEGKYPPLLGRAYGVSDMELMRSVGLASGYIAVLVLALYISSKEVLALYRHPVRLWVICPVLLYWLTRLWMLANRGQMNEDPVVFAVKDKQSWFIGLATLLLIFAAS
jgi:4-hydroxybenzoate polyprenyltransferase